MSRIVFQIVLAAAAVTTISHAASAQWVRFENHTTTRLVAEPALGSADNQEKDFAWGDLNNNGWIDLVLVRKQPGSTIGQRPNVLFMNEGGVLVDRTAQYISASDVLGDQGFLTPTNDRDVVIVDLQNNGWLDAVTAVTLSEGKSKHLSHPRVYVNLAAPGGTWQGLRYEDARIPQLEGLDDNGIPHAPRFCSVAAGDLIGDGFADLYFGDYDIPEQNPAPTMDFNNRLLVNDGNGFFTDETALRLTEQMAWSQFSASVAIVDLNGNGLNDIVKQTAYLSPTYVSATYNSGTNPGFFNDGGMYHVFYSLSPYFVAPADMNNNGRIDLVISDGGSDRVAYNMGNDAQGRVIWQHVQLPNSLTHFGVNTVAADLNNNGWKDVLTGGVHVNIISCNTQAGVYRNNGNLPNPNFTKDFGNLPSNLLTGVYDYAVFDLTGNGWNDIVTGRCAGTSVWVNLTGCAADLTKSGSVGVPDLLKLLESWGPCGGCDEDLTGSGSVGVPDLLQLLATWGPCV